MTTLRGRVTTAHRWVDLTNFPVPGSPANRSRTCAPAMGYSFAAGTTDGPGFADFYQVSGSF